MSGDFGGNMTIMYGGAPFIPDNPLEPYQRPMVAPFPQLTPTEQQDAVRVNAFIQADPELKALAEIIAILSGIEDGARARVAAFVAAKWGPKK